MNNTNSYFNVIAESQNRFFENMMNAAKQMQGAMPNTAFNWNQNQFANPFNSMKDASNEWMNKFSNPQAIFNEWTSRQADMTAQTNEAYKKFMAGDHSAFQNMYQSWMNTMQTSYTTMMEQMNNSFGKNIFGDYMQGNKMYADMQAYFQPMMDAMKNGQFNQEWMNKFMQPEAYRNLVKEMFGTAFEENNIKTAFESGMKELQQFFSNTNNMSHEFMTKMKELATSPVFSNDAYNNMEEFYKNMSGLFTRTFEPMMKVANAGKEKESAEAALRMMDKMSESMVKQAELQILLQETSRKVMENLSQEYMEKMKGGKITEVPTSNEMYNRWVAISDKMFTELFASEKFSKAKGEVLNLSMEIKKMNDLQFERNLSHLPFVFKSEIDELNKTIHALRKELRDLKQHTASTRPVVKAKARKS
jgi:cell fate (sporulation/competence/biofilm development) regulator YlbF (YheA/YmcA/DUF963 family)